MNNNFESRIQILDRNAKKYGKSDFIQNFNDFVEQCTSAAVLQLMYICMEDYAQQEIRRKEQKAKV